MDDRRTLNPDIVPIKFTPRGKHPETEFQSDIDAFFSSLGIEKIEMPITSTEFVSFDLLGMPTYSPVRSPDHVVYTGATLEVSHNPLSEITTEVSALQLERFGLCADEGEQRKEMLVSHATAQLATHVFQHGPHEAYIATKTFRARKEKLEKMQAECVLINRSLPEILALVESMYQFLLRQSVRVTLASDFYYFCEPSFSFSTAMGDVKLLLGSAGFMRREIVDVLQRRFPTKKIASVAFVGLPYQKLLNLRLGIKVNDFDANYNEIT